MTDPTPTNYLNRTLGTIGTIWGVAGAVTLLSFAVGRMAGHMPLKRSPAHTPVNTNWESGTTLVGGVWTLFMGYSEGYKGFQKGYSPRVAARALYLRDKCTWPRLILAPLFCLGFINSTRRRRITIAVLLVVISLIVIFFKHIPQPWRGVLDLGVVVGLSWGLIATLVFLVKFWIAKEVPFDPEVVE